MLTRHLPRNGKVAQTRPFAFRPAIRTVLVSFATGMGADRDGDLKVRQGAPTNPEHIDSEAWAALREAARRAGVPFGEWLKAKLLAGTADLPAPASSTARGGTVAVGDLQRRVSDLAGEIDRLARAEPPATPHRGSRIASPHGEGLVSALDALNTRVEKLLQDPEKGSAAAATHLDETIRRLNERLESLAQEKRGDDKRTEARPLETRPADSFERRMSEIARTVDTLNRKLDRGTPAQPSPTAPPRNAALDAAVAEIAARQRLLDAAGQTKVPPAPPAPRAPVPPPAPAVREVDLSGLERQLNIIADQMNELTRTAPQGEAVGALRGDVAEIKRSLAELAPRRAVEELERAVGLIAQRIERQGSGEANAEIVRTLAGLRDVMEELRPPENSEALEREIEALSRKLDIVRAKTVDGATVARLQAQTSEIRDLLGRALSNDSVRMLAEQVALLVGKIERFANPDERLAHEVVEALGRRIDQLAARIDTYAAATGNDPAPFDDIVRRLDELHVAVAGAARAAPDGMDTLFDGLVERIERMSRPDAALGGSVEALGRQIASIAERINANDSRFDQLTGIERALSDLFVQMEEARASAIAAAEHSARSAAAEYAGASVPNDGMALIQRELADLGARQVNSERRTYDTLEAVHETLGRVVERIASLDTVPATPAEPQATFETPAPVEPAPRPQIVPPPASVAAAAPLRGPAVPPGMIPPVVMPAPVEDNEEPAFPDDFPLEPGSGLPRQRAAATAARIAQSEATVDDLIGRPPSEDGQPAPSRADFIAAARRAAQSASAAKPKADESAPKDTGPSRLSRLLSRARLPLLVAVSGSALAFGAWHLAGTLHEVQLGAAQPAQDSSKPVPAATPAAPAQPSLTITASPPASSTARVPFADTLPSSGVVGGETTFGATPAAPGAPNPSDITGSVGTPLPTSAPGASPSSSLGKPTGAAPTGDLPVAIGGPALRAAALAGDPAAAYEVGARFAEGRGVGPNAARATDWFAFAVSRGSIPAAYRLGVLLEKGSEGLPRDVTRARNLYESAAQAGNVRSMHNFAVLLAEGVDGQPDYTQAVMWFRKAAERGVRDSQYNLGVLYTRGLGVKQDLGESWKWFSLAAAQGDVEAGRKRDEVASRLDQQQLITLRFAVQTWSAVLTDDKANVALSSPDWDRTEVPATKKKTASRV
jgi:localization factor PodJL